MSQSPAIPGCEVGKTYRIATGVLLFAGILYYTAGFILVTGVLSIVAPAGPDYPVGLAAFGTIMLVGAVALHIIHSRNPQRKYTVLSTYSNGDGTFAAKVQHLDGTTGVMELGTGEGFWKQFGGVVGSVVSTK